MTEIETLQVPSELDQMTRLYQRRRPQRILEIGCWDGGTLRVWLQHAEPGAVVVAVDLEHRNAAAYDEWRKSDTTLHLVTGPSQQPDQKAQVAAHAPYDWAFIDGDHGDWGVRTDVLTVKPLISRGGLLLLHDITPPTGTDSYPPGLVFAEFAAAGYETWTYIDPEQVPWSRGVGVVQL